MVNCVSASAATNILSHQIRRKQKIIQIMKAGFFLFLGFYSSCLSLQKNRMSYSDQGLIWRAHLSQSAYLLFLYLSKTCAVFGKKALFSINLLIIFKKQILGDKELTGQNSMQMGQNGLVKGKAKTMMAYP